MDQPIQFRPALLAPRSIIDSLLGVPHYMIFRCNEREEIESLCCIRINDGNGEFLAIMLFNSKDKAEKYLKNTQAEEHSIVRCNNRYLFAHLITIQNSLDLKYAVVDPIDDSPLQALRAFDLAAICDKIDDDKTDNESIKINSFYLVTTA